LYYGTSLRTNLEIEERVMGNTVIKNRKASYEYTFVEEFVAGMQLFGSEVKSIRKSNASISEAYCYFKDGELFIKGMHIAKWEFTGNHDSHEELREKKLLLTKQELKRIKEKLQTKGLTLIPTSVFISKRGYIKLNIALAKGKKLWDKRQSIKEKDLKRDAERDL